MAPVPQRLFGQTDLDRLEAAVYELLTGTGMKVCHPELLRRLQARGAQVDLERQRARLSEEMISEVIALRRAEHTSPDACRAGAPSPAHPEGARDGGGAPQLAAASAEDLPSPERLPAETPFSTGLNYDITPRIYDWTLRRERPALRADLEALVDLGDALPEVQSVGCPVIMTDVDPRVEAIEAFALVVCRTNKPPSVISVLPQHNPYFAEIGEIVLGPSPVPPFIGTGGFLISPLTIGDRLAAMMLEGERYQVTSCGLGSMAVAGLSSPVSIAGTIAVITAELLGACVVARTANPHATSLAPCTASGMLDMRTTKACFGTPEAALQDAGTRELFAARFGGPCGIAGTGYVDGRVPGLQPAYEKLLKAHVFRTLCDYPFRLGSPGLLDAGSVFSPTQYLVETELNAGLQRSDWLVPVSEESVALGTIQDIAGRDGATFLGTDHTLAHFRESWYPGLLDRVPRPADGRADEEQVAARAEARRQAVMADHRLPDVDPERVRRVSEVVAAARRQLLRG